MYELTGTVKVLFDTQTFASGFSKREFVVTTEGKYPQDIKMSMVKDKIAMLDGIQSGDQVKVNFDLRGNEYKERYYVDLNAWKIERVGATSGGSGGPGAAPTEAGAVENTFDDDMPF